MCDICDDWKSKKINSEQAFKRIGDALRNADKKKTGHLMGLSDTILDKDVPLSETDADLDKKWHEENHED